MSTIQRVAAKGNGTSAVHAVSSTGSGNSLVLRIWLSTSTAPTSVTDSAGGTWVQRDGNAGAIFVYDRIGAAAGVTSVTANFGSAFYLSMVSEHDDIVSFDKFKYAEAAAQTAPTSGNTTTTAFADEIALGFFATFSGAAQGFAAGAGYTADTGTGLAAHLSGGGDGGVGVFLGEEVGVGDADILLDGPHGDVGRLGALADAAGVHDGDGAGLGGVGAVLGRGYGWLTVGIDSDGGRGRVKLAAQLADQVGGDVAAAGDLAVCPAAPFGVGEQAADGAALVGLAARETVGCVGPGRKEHGVALGAGTDVGGDGDAADTAGGGMAVEAIGHPVRLAVVEDGDDGEGPGVAGILQDGDVALDGVVV